MPTRILDVSDLHARASFETDQQRVLDALLSDVERQQETAPAHVIVMSGDLAWAGQPSEFELAKRLMLDPLMAITKLGPERVILAPGNHDVDRAAIDAYAEAGWRQACDTREGVGKLMQDADAFSRAGARLNAWHDFCSRFYDGLGLSDTGGFGRVHNFEVDGVPLVSRS